LTHFDFLQARTKLGTTHFDGIIDVDLFISIGLGMDLSSPKVTLSHILLPQSLDPRLSHFYVPFVLSLFYE